MFCKTPYKLLPWINPGDTRWEQLAVNPRATQLLEKNMENIKRKLTEFHAHRAEIEALGVGPALFGPATEGDVGDDDGTWGEDDEYYLGTTI